MTHIVRSGETLSGIASQHETTVATLTRMNPGVSDPNRIQAGQSLNLPEPASRQYCAVGQIETQSGCALEPFELAFLWNDKLQARDAIYAGIFGNDRGFRQRALFDRANEHLKETVLPGEIVIVSNLPVTTEDRRKLNQLKEQARLASESIQGLTLEEAETVKRHLEILDYVTIEGAASIPGSALGVISAATGNHLNNLNSVLEKINRAYLDEITTNPSANRFSPEFYATRQQLFGELDNAAQRLTMSRINIPQYHNVKHTLGLSTKSILHNASEILEQGEVPQLGERIKTVSAWVKGSKYLGWLGIALDGGVRASKVAEACNAGESSECSLVRYQQVGGFAASTGLGGVSGLTGAKVATFAAGTLALAFGVTLGAPVLAVVALSGAAAGAYFGGSLGGDAGEYMGQKIYEWGAK